MPSPEIDFRLLVELAEDAIYRADLDGLFTYANPAALRMLGGSSDSVIGQHYLSFVREDHRERVDSFYLKQVEDQTESTYLEFPGVTTSGETIWLGQRVRLERVSGELTGVVAVARDISKRRTAMRQTLEVTNLYEQILNAIPLQVALFDQRAAYEYVSPSGIADADVREWIIGKTNEEYCERRGLAPEIGRGRTDKIMRVLRSGERVEMSESFADREGLTRHFMRFIDPIRDTDGDVAKALGWGMDITELKQVEQALQDSEARKSAVLETALDCIISIDADGRVLDFNPASESTFGWTREEILGMPMSDYIVPEQYRDAHRAGMVKYLKTGEGPVLGQRIEITAMRKSGEEFPIELAIQPIDLGQEKVFTAYLRDISQRKDAERELAAANERAMDAALSKERFLANMSHEMRTPLNAVIGMTHLLQDTELAPLQQRYVSTIQFSSDNLLALISDLLDYAKITAGKLVFEQVAFSTGDLLEGLQNTFSFRAREKGLAFEVTRDGEIPERLVGDPVRLSQILLNLIANAIKFTDEGGVRLVVRPGGRPDSDSLQLIFEVHDTGVGIDDNEMESVFESFTQATAETTRKYGGTGLGLAIVKELVDRLGGALNVESELGAGSVFSVSLPFGVSKDPAPSEEPGGRMPAGAGLAGKRVLVAEDNDINQFVICSMLQRWGAETDVAHDGLEAVKMVQEKKYDLVLMDIQMPNMDGHDACVAIRSEVNISGDDLPIIALTASTAPDERHRLMRAGMQDFVLKPFEPGALYERLLHHLGVVDPSVTPGDGGAPLESERLFSRERFDAATMGDPVLGIRLIDLFLQDAESHARNLAELQVIKAWQDQARLAHKLKSSAGSLGLTALQTHLEQVDHAARTEEEGVTLHDFETMLRVMEASIERLKILREDLAHD